MYWFAHIGTSVMKELMSQEIVVLHLKVKYQVLSVSYVDS